MKVVCIDPDFSKNNYVTNNCKLEYGEVYDGELIFNIDGKVDWKNNFLNIEGFSEIDWFPTQNFVTLDVWRQKILDELLSTQKQLHVISTSEIRQDKLNDLGI